jgi:hypothetical protein
LNALEEFKHEALHHDRPSFPRRPHAPRQNAGSIGMQAGAQGRPSAFESVLVEKSSAQKPLG